VIGVNDAGATRYFGNRWTIDLVGLNHAEIAHDTMQPLALLNSLDYIAVFPALMQGSVLLEGFEPLAQFTLPLEEYTVCHCPGQTTKIVAGRKR